MKENKVEEFLRKVDRPWGMSMQELEQFQSEVKQLKSEQNKVAVETLERLKGIIMLNNSDEETGDMQYSVDTDCLFEDIDDLIKELKGE